MWICFNDAFLSVVCKDCGPDELLVRARRPGDIEAVFPDAAVVVSTNTDYLFRAVVPVAKVAAALAERVKAIDYDNFKNSVADDKLHDAYSAFWGVHSRLQPTRPYSNAPYPKAGKKAAK